MAKDLELTADDKEFDYLAHFKHRCDVYGSPDDKAMWVTESPRCHATWESANAYLASDGHALLEPKPTGRDTPKFLSLAMGEALACISDMMADSPIEERLGAIRERSWPLDDADRIRLGPPPRAPMPTAATE